MKMIFERILIIGLAFSLMGVNSSAQEAPPEVGFLRIVNAISKGEGMVNVFIDGEDIFPKGYKLGQRTGGYGVKAGAHTISIKKNGLETGSTKVNLAKGETLSMICFAELVPPDKDAKKDEPPVWRIKILLLKQSSPESGYRMALISLCKKDETMVQAETVGKTKPETFSLARLKITNVNLGKSKPEVVIKVEGDIVTVVAPEDPGNYIVLFYEDEAGKVKALSFYDPKFVIAG
jgi:hypothetical protein